MLQVRPVGRDAATQKYDILSALAALALSQDKHAQRRIVRLMALITTRYNWQRNELSMGQQEIARLWCVDLRTVKREMARLRAMGWIVETRAAARGRVAGHALDLGLILRETEGVWPNIGPDFVARQAAGGAGAEPRPAAAMPTNVVPFHAAVPDDPDDPDGAGLWSMARREFQAQDAVSFASWIARLTEVGRDGGRLCVMAPSRFHRTYVETHLAERLVRILRRLDPTLTDLRIES